MRNDLFLLREQFTESIENRISRCFSDLADLFHESTLVDRAELIEDHAAFAVEKLDGHSCRVLCLRCSERSDEHVTDISIHLLGRDYDARPRVLSRVRRCRIEVDEKYVEAIYHCHSFLSNSVEVSSR